MRQINWVDSGKGFAIILVVLVHTCNWLLDAGLGIPWWDSFNEVFTTLRMPLFFLLSGLFASKWLSEDWGVLGAKKLVFLYWIFMLWSVIGSFVSVLGLAIQDSETTPAQFVGGLALSLVRPRFELWFIWALALFFILAKLTRKWPILVQLASAGALAFVWQSGFISVNIGWDGAAKHYLFFLIGVTYREVIFKALERTPIATRVGVIVLWAGLAVWLVNTTADEVPGLKFAGSLLGASAGICLSSLLAGFRGIRQLGKKSLPIYLAHTPIVVLVAFAASFGIFDDLPTPVRAVTPILVAAGAIALALGLHRWAAGTKASVLYEPPSALVKRVERGISTERGG